MALPVWLAVMDDFPAPTMVTKLPEIVATLVFELAKVTGRPEEEVATRLKEMSP